MSQVRTLFRLLKYNHGLRRNFKVFFVLSKKLFPTLFPTYSIKIKVKSIESLEGKIKSQIRGFFILVTPAADGMRGSEKGRTASVEYLSPF
jgi:hypothetical protein